jgi:hypothetical protein
VHGPLCAVPMPQNNIAAAVNANKPRRVVSLAAPVTSASWLKKLLRQL